FAHTSPRAPPSVSDTSTHSSISTSVTSASAKSTSAWASKPPRSVSVAVAVLIRKLPSGRSASYVQINVPLFASTWGNDTGQVTSATMLGEMISSTPVIVTVCPLGLLIVIVPETYQSLSTDSDV